MAPIDQSIIHPGGIDIMVMRGATLPDIMTALQAACGLSAQDMICPGEDIMQRLEILQRPLRAKIYALTGGDFDFKVDIDGLTQRNCAELARSCRVPRCASPCWPLPSRTSCLCHSLGHGSPRLIERID